MPWDVSLMLLLCYRSLIRVLDSTYIKHSDGSVWVRQVLVNAQHVRLSNPWFLPARLPTLHALCPCFMHQHADSISCLLLFFSPPFCLLLLALSSPCNYCCFCSSFPPLLLLLILLPPRLLSHKPLLSAVRGCASRPCRWHAKPT